MSSDLHRVLHPLAGRPLLGHLLDSFDALSAALRVVIVGAGRNPIETTSLDLLTAAQDSQRGTAHAVLMTKTALNDIHGTVLVPYGDVPLIQTTTIQRLRAALEADHRLAVLGFRPADTRNYALLITGVAGGLQQIVKHAETTPEHCAIRLCNSDIMVARSALLWPLLAKVRNNNSKSEICLTDIMALARIEGERMAKIEAGKEEMVGVRFQAQLAVLEQKIASKSGARA